MMLGPPYVPMWWWMCVGPGEGRNTGDVSKIQRSWRATKAKEANWELLELRQTDEMENFRR